MKNCKHQSILCEIVTKNGTLQYRHICKMCGKSLSDALKQTALTSEERLTAHKTTFEKLHVFREQHATDQSREWHDWYVNEYLQSEVWKIKRQRVLARDNYTCQGCLVRDATDVHHLTYRDVEMHNAHEMMFDLISLCERCHERVHEHLASS